jgi:hypothetical protein
MLILIPDVFRTSCILVSFTGKDKSCDVRSVKSHHGKAITCNYNNLSQQFQALNDLLILLSGSLAVFLLVSLDFMPFILAQKDALLGFPTFLLGALRSDPGFSLS